MKEKNKTRHNNNDRKTARHNRNKNRQRTRPTDRNSQSSQQIDADNVRTIMTIKTTSMRERDRHEVRKEEGQTKTKKERQTDRQTGGQNT